VLEDLDKEELMGQFKGKLRTMRVTETAPALPSGPHLRPWFDPSTVNPVSRALPFREKESNLYLSRVLSTGSPGKNRKTQVHKSRRNLA
jgi:hypothetical protein